jgi:hypothetical protein
MQHKLRISRRQFLIAGIVAAHGLLIDHVQRTIGYAIRPSDTAPVVTARVYCPLIIVDTHETVPIPHYHAIPHCHAIPYRNISSSAAPPRCPHLQPACNVLELLNRLVRRQC